MDEYARQIAKQLAGTAGDGPLALEERKKGAPFVPEPLPQWARPVLPFKNPMAGILEQFGMRDQGDVYAEQHALKNQNDYERWLDGNLKRWEAEPRKDPGNRWAGRAKNDGEVRAWMDNVEAMWDTYRYMPNPIEGVGPQRSPVPTREEMEASREVERKEGWNSVRDRHGPDWVDTLWGRPRTSGKFSLRLPMQNLVPPWLK